MGFPCLIFFVLRWYLSGFMWETQKYVQRLTAGNILIWKTRKRAEILHSKQNILVYLCDWQIFLKARRITLDISICRRSFFDTCSWSPIRFSWAIWYALCVWRNNIVEVALCKSFQFAQALTCFDVNYWQIFLKARKSILASLYAGELYSTLAVEALLISAEQFGMLSVYGEII